MYNKRPLLPLASLFFLAVFLFPNLIKAQTYKDMMYDESYNFYDVVEEAEKYFSTHARGKGSGYKNYIRWKEENEGKYYPSGNRLIDPYYAINAFNRFKEKYPPARVPLIRGGKPFSNDWYDIGPYTTDSITSHYSSGIGRVESFWVNPNDETHLFLGSRSGGFWKTTDNGQNWTCTTDELPATGVNAIAVHLSGIDTVLINVRNGGNGTSHGIYRSHDGGDTWHLTNFNPENLGWGGLGSSRKIYKIQYHPLIPNMVFASGTKGVFVSFDNFDTWQTLDFTGYITDFEFHPTDPGTMYFYDTKSSSGYEDYVLISRDTGRTFKTSQIINGNGEEEGLLAVTPMQPDYVYFASDSGVWKSVDTGNTFTFLSNPDDDGKGLAISDVDSNSIIYGYVDAYGSSDGGQTFTQITDWYNTNPDSTYIHADIRTLECINGVYYAGTDGFLVRSKSNGATWTRLNQGTGIRENYAVGISESNHHVQMVGSQDNGTSIMTENGWIEWNGGDGMDAVIQPLNPDWMIGSWQYGSRNRTTDGGQSRNSLGNPQKGSGNADWNSPMFMDPNNQMRVFHIADSTYVSEDFGTTWIGVGHANVGLADCGAIAYNNGDIHAIAADENLMLSVDGGRTYSNINSNLPSHYVDEIAFDPNDDSTIIVAYDRYNNDGEKVFVSHDLGGTWTNITYNLQDMPIRSLAIDYTDKSYIYAGAEIGLFRKAMDDTLWVLHNNGLPNVTIKDLKIHRATNKIVAATWGRGLWEANLTDRESYPGIVKTTITDPPTDELPMLGVDQYVTSVISYQFDITRVFVQWADSSLNFTNQIEMENVSDSTWRSTEALPSFAIGEKLFFKVKVVGSYDDTTESFKYMFIRKAFEYCSAIGADNTTADYIDLFSLNGMTNTSGKEKYGDFTDSIIHINLDSTYTMTIGMDYHWDLDTVFAWLDYNKNAQFEESERVLFTELDNDHKAYGTFVVPSNAQQDTVVLRVRSIYSSTPAADPCGSYTGEVEDYSVIISCMPSDSMISVEACDSFTINDSVYYRTGRYMQTLINSNGCDSSLTINLIINEPQDTSFALEACDSVAFNDSVYYETGRFQQYLTSTKGCDSTIYLTIDVLESTDSMISVEACDSFVLNDSIYYRTGRYMQHLNNTKGCDSALTINLIIHESNDTSFVLEGCDSVVFNDSVYYESGRFEQYLISSKGCDSTIYLTIDVKESNDTSISITSDSSYTYNDSVYNESGVFTHVFENVAGCDSTVDIHLTINYPTFEAIYDTACELYSLNDSIYNETGIFTQTLLNAKGYDSTITLNLIIHSSDYQLKDTVEYGLCVNDSIEIKNKVYYFEGFYYDTVQTKTGCDSTYVISIKQLEALDFSLTTSNSTGNDGKAKVEVIDYNGDYQVEWDVDGIKTIADSIENLKPGLFVGVITDSNNCEQTFVATIYMDVINSAENALFNEYSIFPNPTNNQFTVQLSNPVDAGRLQLYNLYGQLLVDQAINNSNELVIDVATFAEGIYIIELSLNDHVYRERLKVVR